MSSVMFLRGVNIGGHKVFKPAALAAQLAEFGVVNIGAAGTFLARSGVGAERLRGEILRRLSFDAEMMICPGREILGLVGSNPFGRTVFNKDLRGFVTILAGRPRKPPHLPIERPAGARWEVSVFEVTGRYALSLWRRHEKGILYPNEVIEKELNLSATTRSWNTIVTIGELLAE